MPAHIGYEAERHGGAWHRVLLAPATASGPRRGSRTRSGRTGS